MSGCLSDRALARVQAELGTAGEQQHLAGCEACAGRYRMMRREMHLITEVLRETPEPVIRHAFGSRRRWLPAMVGLSAVAVGLLIWVEVVVWRAVTPVPPTMQPQEVAAILSDVSASLFSVNGDPPRTTTPDEPPQSLEAMAAEVDGTLTGGDR
ncbi:MAG TPA: hypothetical protein VFF12_04465 [Myxococcaceae bacterium]|nr:hypothetical protein [Myxococcaceae bacterium]